MSQLSEAMESLLQTMVQMRQEIKDLSKKLDAKAAKGQHAAQTYEPKLEHDLHPKAHISPPPFNGDVPWSGYRIQFDAAAATNGWSEEEQATAMICSLRGLALRTFLTIPEGQRRDLEVLNRVMGEKFSESGRFVPGHFDRSMHYISEQYTDSKKIIFLKVDHDFL